MWDTRNKLFFNWQGNITGQFGFIENLVQEQLIKGYCETDENKQISDTEKVVYKDNPSKNTSYWSFTHPLTHKLAHPINTLWILCNNKYFINTTQQ